MKKKRTKGRKGMFYLTTHSTHFIYGYMASERNLTVRLEEDERGFSIHARERKKTR